MRRTSTLTAVCAIALIGALAAVRWMKSPRAEPSWCDRAIELLK